MSERYWDTDLQRWIYPGMKIENGKAIFSTGRIESCNLGIIGINPELEVHEGYDGPFAYYGYWEPSDQEYKPLTQAEREELADYMIGLWTAYKAQAQ